MMISFEIMMQQNLDMFNKKIEKLSILSIVPNHDGLLSYLFGGSI
jgi:hypothetical protein